MWEKMTRRGEGEKREVKNLKHKNKK